MRRSILCGLHNIDWDGGEGIGSGDGLFNTTLIFKSLLNKTQPNNSKRGISIEATLVVEAKKYTLTPILVSITKETIKFH